MDVLDLFSAAAGGWSLGMHRAGFRTVAACEWIDWRRALYLQNNPGVRMYDDVRTLTGEQLLRDLGFLPRVVVGSPPCQDISPANTKGKGVEGERSGLYFEAVRIIGEVRPRWFALENSANLRARGADAVIAALEALGYTCWPFVVRAGDIGANHERPRSWLIGCDLDQVAGANGDRWPLRREGRRSWLHLRNAANTGDASQDGRGSRISRGRAGAVAGAEQSPCGDAGHSDFERRASRLGAAPDEGRDALGSGRLRPDADDGCGARRSDDGSIAGQMGLCEADRIAALQYRADWSLDDLAGHLRLDDGLSAWVAQSRIAVGGPRGTSAASLIVEAFGDAVVPQIPEAIGRAILRTEAALSAIYAQRIAA
mgnify:CR=1 FL=1